jgi:hypothetical protein
MRCAVAGIGRNRRIEATDGIAMPALRGGDHAQVVGHCRMPGREPKRGTIERFRLGQTAFAVTRNRIRNEHTKISAGHGEASLAVAPTRSKARRAD